MVNCTRCKNKQTPQEITFIKQKCINGCGFYEGFKKQLMLEGVHRDENDTNNFVVNYCPACIMYLAIDFVWENREMMLGLKG